MSNDDRIKVLLDAVELQQSQLGRKPRASYETNAIFRYDDKRHLNINTVKNPNVLVEALAFLLEKQARSQEAAGLLDVSLSTFQWNGYSTEDYANDFKRRIEIINFAVRKTKLDATKKKLKTLVSEEARTGMELDEIADLLQS